MEFSQVDVFADGPFVGNQLAVFPDAADLSTEQMQAIASEMNLSETTFVTRAGGDSYDVRIFTPASEMPFAGHPTLGTAWLLLKLGAVKGKRIVQRSRAGETTIDLEGDVVWMGRTGESEDDLNGPDPEINGAIADALGIPRGGVGMEARELGRSGLLQPALADAGLRQLMVPVKDIATLKACRPPSELPVDTMCAYCFTATGAGRLAARGLWSDVGVSEDPATGSAAAALGVYLVDRIGDIELEISQGNEINRPSRLYVRATKGRVRVGGRCFLVLTGRLEEPPPS